MSRAKLRYVVTPIDLADDHPLWPNERVYALTDSKTGEHVSLARYMKKGVAQEIAKKKNEVAATENANRMIIDTIIACNKERRLNAYLVKQACQISKSLGV